MLCRAVLYETHSFNDLVIQVIIFGFRKLKKLEFVLLAREGTRSSSSIVCLLVIFFRFETDHHYEKCRNTHFCFNLV